MSIEINTEGGLAESDSTAVTVRPTISSPRRAVTTETLEATDDMAARNSAVLTTGFLVGRSAMLSGISKSAITLLKDAPALARFARLANC